MKIVCAWCQAAMGEKEPLGDSRSTHGICAACLPAERDLAKARGSGYLDGFRDGYESGAHDGFQAGVNETLRMVETELAAQGLIRPPAARRFERKAPS